MRRSDREITDENVIARVIAGCQTVRLGFYDSEKDEVYVVPLSFGEEKVGGKYVLWFHGAGEGRKLELVRKTGKAGFEMDRGAKVTTGQVGCEATTSFESVIGTGRVSLAETTEEKLRGLRAVMAHMTGKADWEFDPAMVQQAAVFKLEVQQLSCKIHL